MIAGGKRVRSASAAPGLVQEMNPTPEGSHLDVEVRPLRGRILFHV